MEKSILVSECSECPSCGNAPEDAYLEALETGKKQGMIDEDYNDPCLRQIMKPLVNQSKLNLIAGVGGVVAAPVLIETYCTCRACGIYYLVRSEIAMMPVQAVPNTQRPPGPGNNGAGKIPPFFGKG